MHDPYVIRSTRGCVELWSALRLPYQPRGWLLDMRNDLCRALGDFSRTSSGRLYAVYSAADDGALVDTENVLLFNVGDTTLRPLLARSVTFERSYHVPPHPPEIGVAEGQALHYQRYSEARDDSFGFWTPGKLLSAFCNVPVESVAAAPVWNAIRECAAPPIETATAPTRFLIKVQIIDTRESRPTTSLVDIVKPVLDGIISAYHSHIHEGQGVAEAQRLEAAGIGTARILQDQLLDRRWAALGARRLLWPFGKTGVQWNPADDFCVAAHITLTTMKSVADRRPARWRLSAELMEATPRRVG